MSTTNTGYRAFELNKQKLETGTPLIPDVYVLTFYASVMADR